MGKGSVQTFLQRRPARGQQAYEKVLSTTAHQRNAPRNHGEMPPHTCRDSYHRKTEGECWRGPGAKGTRVHRGSGCNSVQPLQKN